MNTKLLSKAWLLLLPVSLFSYEITFSKTFSKKLQADILNSDLIVKVEGKKESYVSTKLTKFDKFIKNKHNNIEKKLGTFYIRPNYNYKSKNPEIQGYIGELRYNLQAEDPKKINDFISGVINLKDNRDTSIIVRDLTWKVKQSSSNVAKDLLRYEAITWIQNYSKNLSKDLKTKCEVEAINFSNFNNYYPYKAARSISMANESKTSIPVPKSSEQDISINVNYKLECK